MHCLPAILHSHAPADGPMVEQVECQVQLKHCSTISQDHRLGLLTVETLPNPRRSFSLFCPPNGPAAVTNGDTPPAIAQPSLLQLEIAVGISNHTPTHTHIPTHTHTHTHHGVSVDFRRTKGRRLCASGVSSWFEIPTAISNCSRDG